MKRFVILLSLISSIFFAFGFSTTPAKAEETKTYSFYEDVFPIIVRKCFGTQCHGGDSRAAVRYVNHKTIYGLRKKILKRLDDKYAPMPPKNKQQTY